MPTMCSSDRRRIASPVKYFRRTSIDWNGSTWFVFDREWSRSEKLWVYLVVDVGRKR